MIDKIQQYLGAEADALLTHKAKGSMIYEL